MHTQPHQSTAHTHANASYRGLRVHAFSLDPFFLLPRCLLLPLLSRQLLLSLLLLTIRQQLKVDLLHFVFAVLFIIVVVVAPSSSSSSSSSSLPILSTLPSPICAAAAAAALCALVLFLFFLV